MIALKQNQIYSQNNLNRTPEDGVYYFALNRR